MPSLVEQLQTQVKAVDTMQLVSNAEYKQEYFDVENKLKVKGKDNWRDLVNQAITDAREELQETETLSNEAAGNLNDFKNEMSVKKAPYLRKIDIAESQLRSLEEMDFDEGYEEALENADLPEDQIEAYKEQLSLLRQKDIEQNQRDIEKKRKELDKYRKQYEDWQNSYDLPKRKVLEDKQGTYATAYFDIESKIESYNKYITERTARENVRDRKPNEKEQIKNTFKQLKANFEKHNGFFKWLAGFLPYSWTDAGKDLEALDQGKQILLDSGYKESEITEMENEAVNELNNPVNPAPVNNQNQPNVNNNEIEQAGELNQERTNQMQNQIGDNFVNEQIKPKEQEKTNDVLEVNKNQEIQGPSNS